MQNKLPDNQQPNMNGIKKRRALWWFKPLAVGIPAVVLALTVPQLLNSKHSDTQTTLETPVSDFQNTETPDLPRPDPNAGEYVAPEADGEVSQGIAVPGWSSLSIPVNETDVTVDFYNPEENMGQYQLTFELRLPDESEQGYEVLYTSGLIDPGLHVQHITLSRGLEAGVYDAIIHVQPYRMNEYTTTNNADLQTRLIVA